MAMIDEDPSPEDLERFGHDTAHCPECGAEIWDQADLCPDCGAAVSGRVAGRPPVETWFRRRWLVLVVIVALAAFLLAVLL
jgi:predicted amidophosphoribosyltransferase